jgi:hypothetical protein
MRLLGIHAAAGVTLLTIATMAPALAQTADPAPAGTTTTARVDCTDGKGTVVVTQELLESGATRVVVVGHDVHDGRWRGGFAPKAYATSDEDEVEIDVTAVDHEFRTSFEADHVSPNTNMTLVQGFERACAVGQAVRPKSTSVVSANAAVVVRHVDG